MLVRRYAILTVILVSLLAGIGGYYLVSQRMEQAAQVKGKNVVQLTPEVSLEYYTTLTMAKPEVRLGNQKGWPWLYDFLPPDWGKNIPYVRPITGTTIHSYIKTSANSGTMLLMVNLPPNFATSKPGEDTSNKIRELLKDLKINSARFYAEGYGASSPTDIQADFMVNRVISWGLRKPAVDHTSYIVRIALTDVPVMARKLTIQLMEKSYAWEDNPVIREFTIDNPFYRPVTPSAATAAALPVSIKDGDLEVTLRALVSGVKNTNSILTPEKRGFMADLVKAVSGESTATEKRRITLKPGKPIPDAGAIPLDFFDPATTETEAVTYLVADITSGGMTQDEWGIKNVNVTYGKEKFHFGHVGNSSFSYDKTDVRIYNGILSAYPQPVNVAIELVRKSHFPPDESQTVDIPLPKAGAFSESKQSIKLHVGTIDEVVLGYQCREYNSIFGRTMLDPKAFWVIFKGNIQGGIESTKLLGSNGKVLQFENQTLPTSATGTSGPTANYMQYYIPTKEKDRSTPVNYDDYTTARITFRSPRPYPGKFEFTVKAEEATGTEPSR